MATLVSVGWRLDYYRHCSSSIIAITSAGSEVCITGHPSPPALTNGAIQGNVEASLKLVRRRGFNLQLSKCTHYSKVVVADCLWIPSQHSDFIDPIAQFLPKSSGTYPSVVPGFPTEREIVADFSRYFSEAKEQDETVDCPHMAEVGECGMLGNKIFWLGERPKENSEEAQS